MWRGSSGFGPGGKRAHNNLTLLRSGPSFSRENLGEGLGKGQARAGRELSFLGIHNSHVAFDGTAELL